MIISTEKKYSILPEIFNFIPLSPAVKKKQGDRVVYLYEGNKSIKDNKTKFCCQQ